MNSADPKMAPKSSRKKSKSSGNGRLSKKLDELLGGLSSVKDDVQLVHKKIKKQGRQIRDILRALNSLAESRNPPIEVPSTEFQASCCCRSSLNQAESSGLRRLHLSFVCKLPTKLYTASIIHAIDGGTNTNVPVRVVLLDEANNVVNEGPLSSLKVEIFVANGDIKAEELESWTEDELKERHVNARKEKGLLLLGSCGGTMENGSCTFNDLKFWDNSSWVPSKTFKLVAKVAESARLPDMVEIKPAATGYFSVKDQRGKQNEKHSVPSPDDEVWRLNRIGRDGPYHKKLEAQRIGTVEDFLRMYYIDHLVLREILGAKEGTWATIVEHANKCKPNNGGFQYASESNVQLLFNCFYKLVSVCFDNQNAVSLETLDESAKSLVEQLRGCAFKDQSKLVQINTLSGWPSTKTGHPQDPIDPNPHQAGELVEDEFLGLAQYCPLTPLFMDGDLLQHKETAAQSNAAIEDFSSVESDPIAWETWNSLPLEYQHPPAPIIHS